MFALSASKTEGDMTGSLCPSVRTRVALLGVAVAASFCSLTARPMPATAVTPAPADLVSTLHGTWLVGAATPSDPRIAAAFAAAPSLRGISVRMGWNQLAGNTLDPTAIASNIATALAPWKVVAARYHTGLMIRFIAGIDTPPAVFAAGAASTTVTYAGQSHQIPLPWDPATGGLNTVFVNAYNTFVGALAAWCQNNGVNELHLSWYGELFSELYVGPEITSAPGYTYARLLAGHEALVNIGLSYRSPALAVEYPLTGGGGILINTLAPNLATYISGSIPHDDPSVYVQLNNWGGTNNGLLEPGLLNTSYTRRGLQEASSQVLHDWSAMYASLESVHADYAEVWSSMFGLSNAASLAQQIQQFATFVNQLPSTSAVAVTSSAVSAPAGSTITAAATVTTSEGLPTGSVTFLLNGVPAKVVSYLPKTGTATAVIRLPAAGTYALTAQYSGDASTQASTSPPVTVVVAPLPTTTNLNVFRTSVPHGQPITLYAAVANGAVTPGVTGTVTLEDVTAQVIVGSAVLPTGKSHIGITTAAIPAGPGQQIVAIYSGDTNNLGSTSPAVTLTVT